MSWEILIDEQELARLLPAAYARFALPVKESLVVFLSGLPGRFQEQILREQSQLPETATFAQRISVLAANCPVLHKLGQVLARDQRLAPELRQELGTLESMPPRVEPQTIRALLERELGGLESRGLKLATSAIAEASVAVVIPYRDLARPFLPEGVFKILKPGIEERLEIELEQLGRVGEHLDECIVRLGIPRIDYAEAFEQVRSKLRGEVLLDQEQRHLAAAAAIYENCPGVQIPTLYDHCGSRVTAMERVYGEKITGHPLVAPRDRQRLAAAAARALLAQPFLARQKQALFHSDPHAGNLVYTREGRLAVLDWSLVGHLGEVERNVLTQIPIAAVCFPESGVVRLLQSLDVRGKCNVAALRACVTRWVCRMRRGHLPGLTWLQGLLDDAVCTSQLSLSADLVMFRKVLLTLSGVLSEIGPQGFDLDRCLMEEFVRSFARDWPARWVSSPLSKDFAIRLSNVELLEAFLRLPWAVFNFWDALWSSRREMPRFSPHLPASLAPSSN